MPARPKVLRVDDKLFNMDIVNETFEGTGPHFVGPPLVILVKGQSIRMSTVEESYEQLNS